MSKKTAARTYGQHCGLAVALDVTAARWTLLIVRDLAPGPRRFTDLFDGLAGISTDLLTDRLRRLEAAGAVERVNVREPVPGTVYRLTDRGDELARIAGELADWGMPLLPDIGDSPHRTNARWALQTMVRNYEGSEIEGSAHITLDGTPLTLDITHSSATLSYGTHGEAAVLTVETTTTGFFELRRRLHQGNTELPPDTTVAGPLRLLARIFRTMPIIG